MPVRRKVAGPGLAKAKPRAKTLERDQKALEQIEKKFGMWSRPEKVLSPVRAVPTIFPAVDAAMGCGGLPLERYILVHGPSGKGKSKLVLGFGLSFLEAGHVFGLLEPEATTPFGWVHDIMGTLADSPNFQALRPSSYEEAVDATRELFLGTKQLREAKRSPLDSGARALVVLDAITKLAPKSLVEKLLAEGAEKVGVDAMNGSGGRYIAALNAAWTRELTGLLYQTGSTFVAVARERVNQNPRGAKYEVTGGQSLIFEASIRLRVSYTKPVKIGPTQIGTKHMVDVLKLKVADDTIERVEAFFHTSNGAGGYPAGFDRARDVWELARETGAVKHFKRKNVVGFETFDGEILPDDPEANMKALRESAPSMKALEDEARRRGSEKKGSSDERGDTED